MAQEPHDLIAAQSDHTSDLDSDLWGRDTISTLSPWMAFEVKQKEIAAQKTRIHKWLDAVEY